MCCVKVGGPSRAPEAALTVVLVIVAVLGAIFLVGLLLDRRLAARIKRGGRVKVGSRPFNAAAGEHGMERAAPQGRDASYGEAI